MTFIKHLPGDGNGNPARLGISYPFLMSFLAFVTVVAVIWANVTTAMERKQSRIDDLTVNMLKGEIEAVQTSNNIAHTGIMLRLDSMESFLRIRDLRVRP